jgi:hypothetical protein
MGERIECGEEDTEEGDGDEQAPAGAKAIPANEDVVQLGCWRRNLIWDDGILIRSGLCGEIAQVGSS